MRTGMADAQARPAVRKLATKSEVPILRLEFQASNAAPASVPVFPPTGRKNKEPARRPALRKQFPARFCIPAEVARNKPGFFEWPIVIS